MKNNKSTDYRRAPERFWLSESNTWVGSPSIAYGLVRRLAFEERKKRTTLYARIHLADVGHHGVPAGGLRIEVSGSLFQFSSDIKRWPEYHDVATGQPTELGKRMLAKGIPGSLVSPRALTWTQEEVDITPLLSDTMLATLKTRIMEISQGAVPMPVFQSRKWSDYFEVLYDSHNRNCTTFITELLREISSIDIRDTLPVPTMRAFINIAPKLDAHDIRLHQILELDEASIMNALSSFTEEEMHDWKLLTNPDIPLTSRLTFEVLYKTLFP